MALLKIFGQEEALKEASRLKDFLNKPQLESAGEKIAQSIGGAIPVIYASHQNNAVAYDWKIVFNETGKISAFYNVFPELNHNEIVGYEEASLAKNFCYILLKDAADHPRIQKRMDIVEGILSARGLAVYTVQMDGETRLEKIFSTVLLGNWVAFYIAKKYGHDPERVPIVEELKKLL
jgi:glucose/mannose-6-phosphate isomerase